MNPGPLARRDPVHPLIAGGFAALCSGLLAWAWLGDWRWAATGAVLLLLSAVVAATRGAR